MKEFIERFIRKYIKPFFFRKNFPNTIVVPYVYSFLLITLFISSCIIKIYGAMNKEDLPLNVVITVIGGMILSLIALYNVGKSK